MSNKVKDIDAKNHTYYFFNDIININNFDLKNHTKIFLFATFDDQRLEIREIYSVNP